MPKQIATQTVPTDSHSVGVDVRLLRMFSTKLSDLLHASRNFLIELFLMNPCWSRSSKAKLMPLN